MVEPSVSFNVRRVTPDPTRAFNRCDLQLGGALLLKTLRSNAKKKVKRKTEINACNVQSLAADHTRF